MADKVVKRDGMTISHRLTPIFEGGEVVLTVEQIEEVKKAIRAIPSLTPEQVEEAIRAIDERFPDSKPE